MSNNTSSISLADLSAAGVRLRASEAVAVVRELALRTAGGDLPGIPAPEAIRLNSDGSLSVEGPVAADREVKRAARLLVALLANATADVSAPATVRLIITRAFADDEAAYGSLEQFADALAPFAAPDPPTAVRELLATSYAARALVASDEGATIDAEPTADPLSAPAEFDTEDAGPAPGFRSLRPATDRRRSVPVVREFKSGTVSRRWSPWVIGVAIAALFAVAISTRWRWQTGPTRIDPSPVPAAGVSPALVALQPTAASESAIDAVTPPAAETPAAQPPRPVSSPGEGVRPQSASPTRVLADAAFSPAFAPAASAMFYHSGTGPGSAIMRADTDSRGEVLRVTSVVNDRGSNFHPRPSPDGQAIAFDSDRDGERGVYVADANGKSVHRVSGSGFAAVPSWSPDGRRLAYVRAEAGRPRVWNIWTVDVGTGASARVTSHSVGQPWGAAWFPGGDRIAYSHEDRLIVQAVNGGSVRTFNSPIRGRLVRTPAVSPDGKQIIFQVRHDGAWMLDLTSNTMRRVLEDPSAEEFAWSPDGRRVAYHSRRAGAWGVWVMAPR